MGDVMDDHSKIIDFDIAKMAWDRHGVLNFVWPYSRTELVPARDHLFSVLIPLIRRRAIGGDKTGLAVGLLSKWMIVEFLKMFEAATIASRLSAMPAVDVRLPKKFPRLASLAIGRKPELNFFASFAEGPARQLWAKKLAKRFIRETQWNGLSLKLASSRRRLDRVAVQPTQLTLRHARNEGVYLQYEQLSRWFGPMDRRKLLTPIDKQGVAFVDEIVKCFAEIIEAVEESIQKAALVYVREWVISAVNFANWHISRLRDMDDLPRELWGGCIGSSPWTILLASAVRQKGGRVIGHDHGMGDSHCDQLAHHFTNYIGCDVFFTYNRNSVEVKRREWREDLVIFSDSPEINCFNSKPTKPRSLIKVGPIRRLMYVPTAFHGEGARFRPILSDVQYFDWQIRLLAFLQNLNLEVIYKPHPEGRSKVPVGFAESFGFKTVDVPFEQVTIPVDAYLIDFCCSSTTGVILRSEKPVIYFDPGYPELLPEARTALDRRCEVVPIAEDDDCRLQADWDVATEAIIRTRYGFDTTFADRYFANC